MNHIAEQVLANEAVMDTLETLMDRAWPATDVEECNGWVLRSAGSVTQRANSVWPARTPDDAQVALSAATAWYTQRRQPVIFQLTHRDRNEALERLLDSRNFSRQSETLIMTAPSATAHAIANSPAGIAITLSNALSDEWIELWWSVDGRGGPAERDIARTILEGAPAIYATALSEDGSVVGTGRLATVDGWGGLYSMAVRPDARRQGVATAVMSALLDAGRAAGLHDFWLMVTAANTGAQELYANAGFAEVGRYHYRQAPLRRAPGAC
jgi:N-acetylglutamate synthase